MISKFDNLFNGGISVKLTDFSQTHGSAIDVTITICKQSLITCHFDEWYSFLNPLIRFLDSCQTITELRTTFLTLKIPKLCRQKLT